MWRLLSMTLEATLWTASIPEDAASRMMGTNSMQPWRVSWPAVRAVRATEVTASWTLSVKTLVIRRMFGMLRDLSKKTSILGARLRRGDEMGTTSF